MSTANAMMSMSLGEARRREARAKERRERNQVSPEVRAARAAILEKQHVAQEAREAAARAEKEARPDAVRAVLRHASADELFELQRVAGQLDGRRLAAIVADVLRQRQRTAYVPPQDAPIEATSPTAEQDAPEKAAGESPRRRGRPPGSRAA